MVCRLELPGEEPEVGTDPEEVARIEGALEDGSPRLSGEAAREYRKARLREHGVGYPDPGRTPWRVNQRRYPAASGIVEATERHV